MPVPIALAASIIPASTSLIEDSTSLAIYGAEAITKGTIVADVPRWYLQFFFVSGVTDIISITKGTDLSKFIINPSTLLIIGQGRIPFLSVSLV